MRRAIDASIKRKVIEQWLSAIPRSKIAIDNNIGEGTVSGIVSEFKIGLDDAEFDSSRELALQARKQGLNLSELASNFRLHNFIRNSGAAEEDIESSITNVSTNDVSPKKAVEYVNQLYDVSDTESIPLDQVSGYIKEKLEQKKKIEDDIQEANNVLQSKNMSIQTINEYIKLNEKLNEYNLSFQDIDKLLDILVNAKRYGFGGKEIAEKLWNIQELEWKEKELKDKCKKLSKKIAKYKAVIPLTEEITAFGIGIDEILAFKIGVREAAKHYNLPFVSATLRLIEDIKKYNKINGLKKELSTLYLCKFAINEACSSQTESLITLAKLKNHGITEDRILQLNNFLESNGYN